MSSKSTLRARRQRAAEFMKSYPKLVKAKRIGRVVCLDERIRHYRLFNAAGASLDYWAGTGTWLVQETSVRGQGLDAAVEALKDLKPAQRPERVRGDAPLVTIFADASFDYRTRAGGWAAWVKAGNQQGRYGHGILKVDAYGPMQAEMAALANGLHLAKTMDVLQPGTPVLLQSDCLLALQLILSICPGAGNSSASGGLPVTKLKTVTPNRRSIPALQLILDMANELDLRVWVRHVKGHSGADDARSFVNSECDRLARADMRTEQRARRTADAA